MKFYVLTNIGINRFAVPILVEAKNSIEAVRKRCNMLNDSYQTVSCAVMFIEEINLYTWYRADDSVNSLNIMGE